MQQLAQKRITRFDRSEKISESKIQAKIAKQRRHDGWLVFKLNLLPGMPDLMCLKSGVVEFIEVKAIGEKRSPLQRKVAHDLERQGFKVFCLTQDGQTVDEAPIEIFDFGQEK